MDTKALHDLANDADIGFQHDDGWNDAIAVWVDGYMAKPEYLVDIWIDALAGMKDDDTTSLLEYFGKLHNEVAVNTRHARHNLGLQLTTSAAVTMQSSFLGSAAYKALLDFVQEFVEKYADEWWNDVCSYHSEMEEGQREDHLYQQHKDRMLDERA